MAKSQASLLIEVDIPVGEVMVTVKIKGWEIRQGLSKWAALV